MQVLKQLASHSLKKREINAKSNKTANCRQAVCILMYCLLHGWKLKRNLISFKRGINILSTYSKLSDRYKRAVLNEFLNLFLGC